MERRTNYLNASTSHSNRGRIFKERPNQVTVEVKKETLADKNSGVEVIAQRIPSVSIHFAKGLPSKALHDRATVVARRPQGQMHARARKKHRKSKTIWIAIHPNTVRPYLVTVVMTGFILLGAFSYMARVKIDRIKNPPLNTGARTVLGAVSPGTGSPSISQISASTAPEKSLLSLSTHKYEADEPKTIDIPSLKVHAPILPMQRSKTGLMQAPPSDDIAGWFSESNRPGTNGLAVINGMTSSAIFEHLQDLQPDTNLSVTLGNGKKISYRIVKVDRLAADNDGAVAYIAAPDVKEGLNLIAFIYKDDPNYPRHYKEQMVVYTERQ
jgi:hypothetical protein